MTDEVDADEVVVVSRQDLDFARETAQAHGVRADVLSVGGIEPVATVALLIAGSALAVSSVCRILDQRKGGQVIDLRPGVRSPLYRTPQLLYGVIVVLARDGTVTVEVARPDDMFTELISVVSGVTRGARGLAGQELLGRVQQACSGNAIVTYGPAQELLAASTPEGGEHDVL